MELADSSTFALYLVDVVRVDVSEGYGKDPVGHVAQCIESVATDSTVPQRGNGHCP